ncbi:MAG: hypothetical protein K2I23_00075 [Clostridia bacterium]|nr:hypothetical protein [Clostridia bacterium]
MNFSKRINRGLCLTVCFVILLGIAFCCLIDWTGTKDTAEATAITSTTGTYVNDDLLLADYTTRNDGKVFNNNALREIYKKITGYTDITNVTTVATTPKSGNTYIHSGLDSSEIRTNNDNKNLVITLGGKKWIVTSLSSADGGIPILTLLLADNAEDSQWSTYYNNDYTHTNYPWCTYGTSYIRARLLNGKDFNGDALGYSNSKTATSLTTYSRPSTAGAYPFEIFNHKAADTSAKDGIADFLVQPKYVAYQRTQSMSDQSNDPYWYTMQNEACDTISTGWRSSTESDLQGAPHYYDWGSDYLWIPSWSELGTDADTNPSTSTSILAFWGLWRLDNIARGSSADYWTRTRSHSGPDWDYFSSASGNTRWIQQTTRPSLGVRPCIHLNLADADNASLAFLDVPKDVTTLVYTSDKLAVNSGTNPPDWYTSVFDDTSSIDTVYKKGNTVLSTLPVHADTYTVEFTINSSKTSEIMWKDYQSKPSLTRSITFTINPKPITATVTGGGNVLPSVSHTASELGANDSGLTKIFDFHYQNRPGTASYSQDGVLPTVDGDYAATVISVNPDYKANAVIAPINFTIEGAKLKVPSFALASQPYTGSTVSFTLNDFDPNTMQVVRPLPTGVNFDDVRIATATRAGEYTITVELKDKSGSMFWSSGVQQDTSNKDIKFTITPMKIQVDLSSDDNSGTIELEEHSKITLNGLISGLPNGTESVNILFSAEDAPYKYSLNYNNDGSTTAITTGYPVTLINSLMNIELHTDTLAKGEWALVLKSDNTDYEIDATPIKIKVVAKTVIADPTWMLIRNGARIELVPATLGDSTPITYSKQLTYNDRNTYSFQMLAPGFTVDTTYDPSGYKVVASNSNNTAIGKNADTYTTSVRLLDKDNNATIYTIEWTIDPVKFDLSKVKWLYDDGSSLQLPYDKVNGSQAKLDPKTLPKGLVPNYPSTNEGTTVGTSGTATVTFTLESGYEGNYVQPDEADATSYIDPNSDFKWNIPWNIVKAEIISTSWKNVTATDANGKAFSVPVLRDPNADGGIVEYEYYETDSTGNILDATNPLKESDIVWSESESKFYIAKPILKDTDNYELDDISAQSKVFRVGKDLTKVSVSLESATMEYNSNPRHAKIVVANGALPTSAFDLTYYDGYTKLSTAPSEVGQYRVEVSLKSTYIDKYEIDGDYEFDYEIVKGKIPVEWNDNAKPSVLKLSYGQINGVEYEIVDADDNAVAYNALQAGKPYRIRAKIKDNQLNNFEFADGTIETAWHEFSVTANDRLQDPNSPSNPAYPQTDPDLPAQEPTNPDETGSGDEGGSGSLGDILAKLKEIPLWQIIAIIISIILIIIFLSKTAGYEGKRKKFNKKADKLETSVYAGAFLGLAMSGWTAIACVLMALAVASLVIMLIAKSRCNKAEENYEDCLEEYKRNEKNSDERRREDEYRRSREDDKENMRMMFMSMMGGQAGNMGQGMPQGGYMGGGYGIEDIRGIISETVTALLPGMQQMLPQQASSNDEIVQRLIDENAKSQETIQELMQKLSEQSSERIVEREVASSSANDEAIKSLIEGQRIIMEKLANQSNESQQPQVQVIEKEVPIEKIVEKVVEVPVEKIVEVPVEVEKIVEKEVKVEVPVEVEKIIEKEVVKEVPVEVEKIVEKEVVKEVKVEVPVAVAAPSKPKKEAAPRLTLDEAYALLSKQQQKYFDGLRQYALSKPNSKEKKATYAITIGQSTVNPLLKLTIKKDTTVALFKMEDEYLKDIKRDATSDGTKVKVKETEVVISDAQACKVAKNMIDLREDQIERYQDLLKEQRAMKNKK